MQRNYNVKPFFKWAGGKTQLIAEIQKSLSRAVLADKFTYVEPFVGSGTVFISFEENSYAL